jgi:hypothetical protein
MEFPKVVAVGKTLLVHQGIQFGVLSVELWEPHVVVQIAGIPLDGSVEEREREFRDKEIAWMRAYSESPDNAPGRAGSPDRSGSPLPQRPSQRHNLDCVSLHRRRWLGRRLELHFLPSVRTAGTRRYRGIVDHVLDRGRHGGKHGGCAHRGTFLNADPASATPTGGCATEAGFRTSLRRATRRRRRDNG